MDEPSAATPASKAPKLPIPGRRNVLITSALPYVNNVPHLGNIIGCVLSADVFTRYCRLRDYNVIYICGTDEYGTATEIKAMKENVHPQEICDRYHDIHKEVYDWFDISFDMFGRTSNPEQKEVCQAIFHKLMDNNWLSQKTIEQLYCNQCERFLADRFVEGTCPNLICNNESARGDQCQLCEKMLTPKELRDPKCQICRSSPHTRDTNHLFLELPLLKDKLENYIKSVEGSWSKNAKHITDDWLKRGLEPRCITRDLRWGVSVPHEGFEKKVFYVWFDAPIGYISITKSYTPEWEKWWKDPENVELYQFMGKDNVSFHSVLFPSSLLGTGERWTMVKTICATEYLNYESGKFSKSNGVGVFGNDVKDTGIPAEVWRYYLLINRPEESDTTFSWKDLQTKLNKELLGNLGNFINRVIMFLAKPPGSGYNSILPDIADATPDQLPVTFGEKIGKLVDDYINHMEKVKLKEGLKTAMSISTEGNGYLQHTGFHKIFKDNPSSIKCSIVMKTSVGLVYILATLLEPFMPSFSVKVLKLLNLPSGAYLPLCNGETGKFKKPWDLLQSGHRIGKPEHLFVKLEEVENLEKKYAGSQADRTKRAEDDARKEAKKLGKTKLSGSPTTVIP